MFLWLALRWPRNPFWFFFDLATLIFDALLLVWLPFDARQEVMISYAARLDCARVEGVLPAPPPLAERALRQAMGMGVDP
jgi:hypothetical protein